MCENRDNLRTRHSFYGPETRRKDSFHSEASFKSDVIVVPPARPGKVPSRGRQDEPKVNQENHGDTGEYYKRYELDEIPVKDDTISNKAIAIGSIDSDKASLTNSDLEKLEKKIYNNISQELQTDDSSVSTLESNIKLFKTTVQEIFDHFYDYMADFDLYKKRFEDILAKNRVDSIADMEEFIKDMIHHIMSSESALSRESRNWMEIANLDVKDKVDPSNASGVSEKQADKLLESLHSVVEAYKNDNYNTDSTFDDKPSKLNSCTKKEETFNIYLLSGVPYVQIKMNDRHLLSEINIKDQTHQEESHVASAENLKSLAAKKEELEKYVKQQQDNNQAPDREIPVKVSFAKKNIYLNEDFSHERDKDDNRSLMSKICSYICKKFRKS